MMLIRRAAAWADGKDRFTPPVLMARVHGCCDPSLRHAMITFILIRLAGVTVWLNILIELTICQQNPR